MMNGRAYSVILLTCIIVNHQDVYSKWTEGTIETKSNWEFLTRFCFLSQNGVLDYEFSYPVNYGTQEVLLYYDEPGQWSFAYRPEKTCSERLSVLSIASNQIIALNTSHAETSLFSGCELISKQGSTWYHCKGQRSFKSSRERWWYIAIARCGESKAQVVGLYLQYTMHMTNGDDLLHKEYSADQFFMLRRKHVFHTTYKLFLAALFFWSFHLLLVVIAWGYYGSTGLEQGPLEVTGRIMQAASTAIFILMLILMAKGYMITRGRLPHLSVIKITVFFTLYILTIVVLFIWEGLVIFDPGKVLYFYESPPGYGMLTMHFLAWLWFLYATTFTIKNSKTKVAFYIPFFGFYTLWFLAGPIVTLVAMFAMAKWSRQKTVNGVEQFVTFLGHIVFLVLTRPSAANTNFPYHIRTSQVDTRTSEQDVVNGTNNAYVVSTGFMISGAGPNLELFITSKTEQQQASNSNASHRYSSLGPIASRSSDIPSASYSQVARNEVVVLSVTSEFVHSGSYFNGTVNESSIRGADLSPVFPTAPTGDEPYSVLKETTSPPPPQVESPPSYMELFQTSRI